MSLALVQSRALIGLDAAAVTVEVHLANGLPSFTLVGLADVEVKEARERVRCALPTRPQSLAGGGHDSILPARWRSAGHSLFAEPYPCQ